MMSLETEYQQRFDNALVPVAAALQTLLEELLLGEVRIDRISTRAKSVGRFLSKAATVQDGNEKYSDPLSQIQDQIGARIITFYRSDVDRISEIVERYFRSIESRSIVPDSNWAFGYFGKHLILFVPSEVTDCAEAADLVPDFFEIQIKTLFQHAWSEANHDLGYKPGPKPIDDDEARRLAFTAAQAWGADHIFDELFQERTMDASRA